MSPLRVGLTGGLASGKSTVSGRLAERGFLVVDADRLVADLYAPGAGGARLVAELFGPEALGPDGAVDRPALADRVFTDASARRRLEAAIHPLVRQRFEAQAVEGSEAGREVAVLEATLLVEAGYTEWFDLVVTVEAPRRLRVRRAIDRGLAPADARRRLEAQGRGTTRRAVAHRVIWNHGDLDALHLQADRLARELRSLAGGTAPPGDLLSRATLVTGNANKLAEVRRITAVDLPSTAIDLPEIQSLDLLEVLAEKGREAYRRLAKPLIVEEAGLGLYALGGFPGPLVKWMLEASGPEGIARTAAALGDTGAEVHCALLYVDGERQVLAEATIPGRTTLPPRGEGGFGFDPIFAPEGEEKTYAELTAGEKDRIGHRGTVWRRLKAKLR